MGYLIDNKTKQFCKLVCFAQNEIDLAMSPEAPAEGYVTNEIVNRFKKHFGVEKVHWITSFPHTEMTQLIKEKVENPNYIHQKVQGGWEFGISCLEFMSIEVEVLNNGEIHLDFPSSEEIFNYVLD